MWSKLKIFLAFAGCLEMNWRDQECLTLKDRFSDDYRIGLGTMSV
jgi:hypothetical protein